MDCFSEGDKVAGAVVITGPTASGKTDLALSLCHHFDAEIISADSAQVYRGLDVGSAKPDAQTQLAVPHHLIDIRDPSDPYSAADFRADAIDCVDDVIDRGKLPIIAGGTMLYLKALRDGLADLPEADQSLRDEILRQASSNGWDSLHQELQQIDPAAASRIRPSDTQRLQRAIEVFRITGQSMSDLHRASGEPCPFPLLFIAIMPLDRAILHERITLRFHKMLEAGFVEEVKTLFQRQPQIHSGLPAIKAVGYRQIWRYLEGKTDYDQMIETAMAATRQLAKRQYTWLRSWSDLHVLDAPNTESVLKIISGSTILE